MIRIKENLPREFLTLPKEDLFRLREVLSNFGIDIQNSVYKVVKVNEITDEVLSDPRYVSVLSIKDNNKDRYLIVICDSEIVHISYIGYTDFTLPSGEVLKDIGDFDELSIESIIEMSEYAKVYTIEPNASTRLDNIRASRKASLPPIDQIRFGKKDSMHLKYDRPYSNKIDKSGYIIPGIEDLYDKLAEMNIKNMDKTIEYAVNAIRDLAEASTSAFNNKNNIRLIGIHISEIYKHLGYINESYYNIKEIEKSDLGEYIKQSRIENNKINLKFSLKKLRKEINSAKQTLWNLKNETI